MGSNIEFRGITLLVLLLFASVGNVTITNIGGNNSGGDGENKIRFLVSEQQVPIIQNRIDNWQTKFPDKVGSIELEVSGVRTTEQLNKILSSIDPSRDSFEKFDIISMDIIWVELLAKRGLLADLSDLYQNIDLDNYLEGHHDFFKYQKKYISSPFFFDAGILLYRTDILQRNGFTIDDFRTWSDFKTNLNKIIDNETELLLNPNLRGFTFQGDTYEGLIVNTLEWMGASNGSFFNENNRGNFLKSGKPALSWMKSLVATRHTTAVNNSNAEFVSERPVLVGDETSSYNHWISGDAVFQRNWPFSYVASLDDPFLNGSKPNTFSNGTIKHSWPLNTPRFGVTKIPYNATICGSNNQHNCSTSALGGSVFGIPKSSANKNIAKLLLQDLASFDAQFEMFTKVGNFPVLKSVYGSTELANYQNGSLLWANEFHNEIFPNVIARPKTHHYVNISLAIQPIIHDTISGVIDIQTGLRRIDQAINSIVDQPLADLGNPWEYIGIGIIVFLPIALLGYFLYWKTEPEESERISLTKINTPMIEGQDKLSRLSSKSISDSIDITPGKNLQRANRLHSALEKLQKERDLVPFEVLSKLVGFNVKKWIHGQNISNVEIQDDKLVLSSELIDEIKKQS